MCFVHSASGGPRADADAQRLRAGLPRAMSRGARTTRWPAALLLALATVLLLSGCAAEASPAATGGSAGFWLGIWHGLILPVTFVVSLFNDSVAVYEIPNKGHLYDLGFVFGAGGLSLPGFLGGRRR